MNRKFLKTAAVSTASVLLLSGCVGDYGWPMIAQDDCGQIVLADPSMQNPPLYFEQWDMISSDVPRFITNIEWRVENAPEGFAMDPDVSGDVDRIHGYGVPTLPINWIAQLEADFASDNDPLQLDDEFKFIYGFQAPPPQELSVNASGNFVYANLLTQEELLPLDFYGGDFLLGQEDALLPLFYSFFHLPTTLIANCGSEIAEDDFFETPSPSPSPTDSSSPSPSSTPEPSKTVNRLFGASSLETYPGYVDGLIDFVSEPNFVRFSTNVEDGRVPMAASVSPWFTGFSNLAFFEGGPEFDFDSLTDFERFWVAQELFLQTANYGQFEEIANVYSFINEGFYQGPDAPWEYPSIEVELTDPLTQDTYQNLFYNSYLAQHEQNQAYLAPQDREEPEARESYLGRLGELEYLFIYVFYVNEINDPSDPHYGQFELSYSFERFYPGVQGNIITEQQFVVEQQSIQSAPYSGPVISQVTPNPVKPGGLITLNGSALSKVNSLDIDSANLEIIEKSEAKIIARLPLKLSPGLKDLVIGAETGNLTHQSALRVLSNPDTTIKSLSRNKVLVEVKNPVGLGRVQIRLNGRQVASVDAKTFNDASLKQGKLTRNLTLRVGRINTIEIIVDGEVVRKVRYRR